MSKMASNPLNVPIGNSLSEQIIQNILTVIDRDQLVQIEMKTGQSIKSMEIDLFSYNHDKMISTGLNFDSKTSFTTLFQDILKNKLVANIINPLLQNFGITQEDITNNMDIGFSSICSQMKISEKGMINNALITMAMNDNDILKTADLLINGLDPNTKIRRDKWLVHLCGSVQMLELLLGHGLDLSINKPLLWVPMDVFIYI